jgi:hypothetical protein
MDHGRTRVGLDSGGTALLFPNTVVTLLFVELTAGTILAFPST